MKTIIAAAFICAALATSACSRFDESVVTYENGDYATALWEWRRLARVGYPPALYNLAVAYHDGAGVPKDMVQVYKWINLAAAYDYESAIDGRPMVVSGMSQAQIAEAQQLIRDWFLENERWP